LTGHRKENDVGIEEDVRRLFDFEATRDLARLYRMACLVRVTEGLTGQAG